MRITTNLLKNIDALKKKKESFRASASIGIDPKSPDITNDDNKDANKKPPSAPQKSELIKASELFTFKKRIENL
jgi:hypothetical protein